MVQVVLWDAANSTYRMSDTLVMQNLGYFQLQVRWEATFTRWVLYVYYKGLRAECLK
jgi:hypothetical protein